MKSLGCFLLLVSSSGVFAQNAVLRGVVKGTSGELLPYANLVLLPDSAYASTDSLGVFHFHTVIGMKRIIATYTGIAVEAVTCEVVNIRPGIFHVHEAEDR